KALGTQSRRRPSVTCWRRCALICGRARNASPRRPKVSPCKSRAPSGPKSSAPPAMPPKTAKVQTHYVSHIAHHVSPQLPQAGAHLSQGFRCVPDDRRLGVQDGEVKHERLREGGALGVGAAGLLVVLCRKAGS